RTAAAMWRYWFHQAYLTEARARLERLLALPDARPRTSARARALGALGSIAYWQRDYAAIRAPYEEAVEIARELGDAHLLSVALLDVSFVPAVVEDDAAGAAELLDEALALAPEDDVALRLDISLSQTFMQARRGDAAGAIRKAERSLALQRE